jgi:endonuclease/exonuclease/phosphatase family metal-dependent hydrolase
MFERGGTMRFAWMKTPVVGILLTAALFSCSSDEGSDEGPVKSTYVIDTFNVALAGSFVPYEKERRGPVMEAVASMDADVVCIQEAWRKQDKDDLVAAVKDRFPHVVRFEHDFESEVDDPADRDGNVPPVPTTPPCGAEGTREKFDAVLQCLVDKCSTIPGSRDGKVNSASCAEDQCFLEAAPLLSGTEDDKRCYGCAVTSLPEDTLGKIENKCTTNPKAALAFDGQSGVMILSRYPLVNAEDWVLPGTWNRRVILRATARLPAGEVDVYCNHLTPVFFDMAFPYTGDYGEGLTGPEAWAAEQKLQVEKLHAYLLEHSAGRKAIILGDFNAGHEHRVDDRMITRAEGEEAMKLLEQHYVEALLPDYAPACTYCSSNVLTGLTKEWESAWVDHIFLHGIDAESVLSSERTFLDGSLLVDNNGEELEVPVSDHYGMRATISLRP